MKYSIYKNIFSAAVFCLLIGVGQVLSQSTVTGGISGRVVDPQGAIIPNATITVTNNGTNKTQNANATDDGTFRFTNLQPGIYTVEVAFEGFANFKRESVVVEVGQITTVTASMSVTAGDVQVTVDAPVINSITPEFSNNIDQTSINELPINGRRASNFVLLTPGVAPDGNFGLISFRGISGLLNNSTVDGGDNNQAFFSEERGRTRINYSISQDAIREFQVNTSNYSAEFGRAAGGVVNSVTKSGTNEFHGSAFYYLRDNKYGARNAFATQSVLNPNGSISIIGLKPKDERHQFGGSIGGPIAKDRLFFFFSYDQQIRDFPGVAAPGSPTFLNPITVALPIAPRTCSSSGQTASETLACRGVTQTQVNAGLNYLRNLTGEVPRKGDQTLFLPKIDWVINNKHSFSAVFNRLRWDSPAGVQTQAVVTRGRTAFGDDKVSIDTLNLRLNSNLSATFLNEARFQYSRDLEQQFGQAPDPSEPTTANGFPPGASIGGGSGITIGKPNFLDRTAYPDEKRWQFANTTTLIKGTHTLKFGGDINRVSDVLDNLFQNAGIYTYTTLADFLTDFSIPSQKRYSRMNQGFGPTAFKFSTTDYNFFVQDDIRVNPSLSVNLGLRYEYQQLPDPQIPNALEARTATFPADKNNFGPRVGFAYDIFGDGKTSFRGGYGIYFGRIINSTISNAITNTGVVEGQRQFQRVPGDAGSPTYPNILATPPNVGSTPDIVVFSRNMENPLIHQGDVVLERVIAKNTVVSISGLFSWGRNLPTFVDSNLNAPTGSTTYTFSGGMFNGQTLTIPRFTGARPNTNFGRITEIRSTIESDYQALVLQINRRLSDGIQFQSSYTYSSSFDNGQISQTFTNSNVPLNPFDLSLENGPSNFDIPHRFVASLVYAPKTFFGLGEGSSVGRAVLGGWTFSPIFTAQTGVNYDAGVGGNAPSATSTGIFGAGGANRLPNVDRNLYRQPSIYNLDTRVSRRFKFTETTNLEILAEGFNVFNRRNITGVDSRAYNISGTNLNFNANFGIPTAAGNSIFRERQIQFAARFAF